MPRPPRLQFDNGIFHVGTRGNCGEPLFTNAADATRFAAGWRWSSYRATVGLAPRPAHLAADELLELFAPDPARAKQLFAEFLHSSLTAAA